MTRTVGVVIAVAAVVYPIYTVAPVAAMTEQGGYVLPVRDACGLIGHSAVVVLHADSDHLYLDRWAPQTLRGWCGADVAIMKGNQTTSTLVRLSSAWKARGRELFVVAAATATIRAVLPDTRIRATRLKTNTKLLATTLTKRPDKYQTQSFQMLVALVPSS